MSQSSTVHINEQAARFLTLESCQMNSAFLSSNFYSFFWLIALLPLPLCCSSLLLSYCHVCCLYSFKPLLSLSISHSLRMTFLQNTSQLFRPSYNRWEWENIILLLVCSAFSLFPEQSERDLPREQYTNNTPSVMG